MNDHAYAKFRTFQPIDIETIDTNGITDHKMTALNLERAFEPAQRPSGIDTRVTLREGGGLHAKSELAGPQ